MLIEMLTAGYYVINFIWYRMLKDNQKKWLQRILQINKSDKIDVLLVFSEGETLIISENKSIFKKNKIKIAVNDYNKVIKFN